MNITDIKNVLTRKFRGASLDDVQGITNYSIFGEAASNLLAEIDPYETVRHGEINLFDKIYDYSPWSDLKGKKLLDLRPQANRSILDDFNQTFTEDFDRDKDFQNDQFSVEFDEGSKVLRINKDVANSIAVDDVSSITSWTASGGATNLAVDTILFFENGASLRFDLGATGGTLTSSLTAVDLSEHENKSSLFRKVFFPDSSIITSVTLRIGSSATDYFSITGTIHLGTIRSGVNIYRFDWNGATETGTVDTDNMDYEQLIIVSTSADTDIRIGQLTSKLPVPYEGVYYSNAIFRPASGSTWITQPTAETDILLLETEHQNIFIYECCLLISDDLQHPSDMEKFRQKLHGFGNTPGLYSKYKKDKPSETIRPQARYYRLNQTRGHGRRI